MSSNYTWIPPGMDACQQQIKAVCSPGLATSSYTGCPASDPSKRLDIPDDSDSDATLLVIMQRFRTGGNGDSEPSNASHSGNENANVAGELVATLHDSPQGAPVVSVIHPGGHKYPEQVSELIVKFFKEHRRDTQSE